MSVSKSDSYAAAGVDVTAGYEAVNRIKPLVESTNVPGVIGGLGGFGGMFEPQLAGMKRPITVSASRACGLPRLGNCLRSVLRYHGPHGKRCCCSKLAAGNVIQEKHRGCTGTDGVGTKLKLAFLLDKHDTVGIDCVAMCVNDIVCAGASPMFFLDYIACGKNDPKRIESIVSGIAEGCRQAGCALIGGETAEMPGFYPVDEYDLAGFSVGLVDYDKVINSNNMQAGDILIGLASSGVHSNGYSLVRKVLNINETYDQYNPELGCTLGEELLKPTRIYVRAVKCLMESGVEIHGIRMYNTFNMGIGMVIAVPNTCAGEALSTLVQAGERAYIIGNVTAGETGVEVAF